MRKGDVYSALKCLHRGYVWVTVKKEWSLQWRNPGNTLQPTHPSGHHHHQDTLVFWPQPPERGTLQARVYRPEVHSSDLNVRVSGEPQASALQLRKVRITEDEEVGEILGIINRDKYSWGTTTTTTSQRTEKQNWESLKEWDASLPGRRKKKELNTLAKCALGPTAQLNHVITTCIYSEIACWFHFVGRISVNLDLKPQISWSLPTYCNAVLYFWSTLPLYGTWQVSTYTTPFQFHRNVCSGTKDIYNLQKAHRLGKVRQLSP